MSYDLMRTTQVDNLLSLESLKNELMEGEQVYCIDTKTLYIKDGTDVVPITSRDVFMFDTIADLQLATWLREDDVVDLNGYYTVGDGANHKRIISTVDDGSGVAVGSLFANLIVENVINIKHFGAVGDGITDDDLAKSKAILYAKSTVNILYAPKGFYLVRKIDLRNASSIHFYGDGVNNTRFYATDNLAEPFLDLGYSTDGDGGSHPSSTEGVNLHDFRLVANGHSVLYGISHDFCRRSNFENIRLNGFDNNIFMNYSWLNTYTNVVCSEHIVNGIHIAGASVNDINFNNVSCSSQVTTATNYRLDNPNTIAFNGMGSEGEVENSIIINDGRSIYITNFHQEGNGKITSDISYDNVNGTSLSINGGLFWASDGQEIDFPILGSGKYQLSNISLNNIIIRLNTGVSLDDVDIKLGSKYASLDGVSIVDPNLNNIEISEQGLIDACSNFSKLIVNGDIPESPENGAITPPGGNATIDIPTNKNLVGKSFVLNMSIRTSDGLIGMNSLLIHGVVTTGTDELGYNIISSLGNAGYFGVLTYNSATGRLAVSPTYASSLKYKLEINY